MSAWELIELAPSQDNTLYETAADEEGIKNEMSNGSGNSLFVGRTGLDAGYKRRRALLQFDVENSLPPGAEIIYTDLSLYQAKAAPNSPPAVIGLHRVLQSWGEGASNAIGPEGQGAFAEPPDATWHHSIYPDIPWTVQGGSFEEVPSAVSTIGRELRRFSWDCSPTLLADLQFWQENPESNFGWVMVGGEATGFSAHKFSSRENGSPENHPVLTIMFKEAGDIFQDGFETTSGCFDIN